MIEFYGYKSLLHQSNISFCIHDGHYSIRIKSISYPLYLQSKDIDLAYDHCQKTFFEMVDMITDIFGYKSYSVTGRSGGYIEPLIEGYYGLKPIDVIYSEYIAFDDFIIQQKIDSYAQLILKVKNDIESIYKHSKDLNQLNDLLEKVYEGIVYV